LENHTLSNQFVFKKIMIGQSRPPLAFTTHSKSGGGEALPTVSVEQVSYPLYLFHTTMKEKVNGAKANDTVEE